MEARPMIVSLLVLALVTAFVLFLLIGRVLHFRRAPRFFRRPVHPADPSHGFTRKKPEWVRNEVIRLKAVMPHESCRKIAGAFNFRHDRKGETVGKTYVGYTIRRHAVEILRLRRNLKKRKRRQGPRNLVWSMDKSFLSRDKRSLPALGILDHGTRRLLSLRELRDRSTIGVLRLLLDTIEKFGRPRFLRTDNEKIFTSGLMSFALFFLGIRHQRTDPYSPWQNGRIERLFLTLKERLYSWWAIAGAPDQVQNDLDTFRSWYNHARPHQSLGGITPAMAWAGVTTSRREPRFFEAWDGILTGFVVPT
jgi:transposase InsO family protein